MNKRNRLAVLVLALCLPVIVVVTALQLAVFDKGFFMEQTRRNEVTKYTGLPEEEISQVADEIFSYMKGEREDFDITAQKYGQEIHLFTADEDHHMVDVRNLYNVAVLVRSVALLLTAAMILWLAFKNPQAIVRGLWWGGVIGAVLIGLIAIAASFDFTEIFYLGHELLFSNDLWLLPADSYLLNLVPEPYWINLFLRIGIYAAVAFALTLVVTGLLKRRIKMNTYGDE